MRDRLRRCFVVLVLALAAALSAGPASALEGPRWFFAPMVGWTLWDDNYGGLIFDDEAVDAQDGLHAGARLGYVFGGGVGFELAGGWSPGKAEREDTGGEADMPMYYGSANIIYSPFEGKGGGGPFLSAGFGWGVQSLSNSDSTIGDVFPSSGEDNFDQGVLDLALGWMFPLGSSLGLRLEARNLLWVPDGGVESAKLNYVIFGGALAFNFGGKVKDSDLDGVADSKDKCPNTPSGAKVDANGCPIDADGDGVADGIDQCPNTLKGATVDARGCTSDFDSDGVVDGIDQCADTPRGATVDARGCPTDADGDGVVDGIDQCPNTPAGSAVDAKGCPADSDGDGVTDDKDKCPRTPAGMKVDVDGCPVEMSETKTELLEAGLIRLEDLGFDTGKSTLTPEAQGRIDIVGQLLQNWPELRIEVGGHTDSRGTAAANQKLSQQRAEAVKDYLFSKYPDLKAEQYTVKGYGESKPVAPNNNAANMARNRRVEFKVLNTDVLRRELEKNPQR